MRTEIHVIFFRIMAAIFDFQHTLTSQYSRDGRPRNIMYIRWNLIAIMYATKDIGAIHVLPVHGPYFNFDSNSLQPLSLLSAATLLY